VRFVILVYADPERTGAMTPAQADEGMARHAAPVRRLHDTVGT
jgi:hypothetical protein